MIEDMAPVLTRLFTPLFTILLLGFLATMAWTGSPIKVEREVLIGFDDASAPRMAGLYAEGRIETENGSGLTIPASALVREGDKASAWRVRDGRIQKAALSLGERDPRTGEWPVRSGLDEGDRVLRYPSTALKEGQTVRASVPPSSSTKTADNARTAAARN